MSNDLALNGGRVIVTTSTSVLFTCRDACTVVALVITDDAYTQVYIFKLGTNNIVRGENVGLDKNMGFIILKPDQLLIYYSVQK